MAKKSDEVRKGSSELGYASMLACGIRVFGLCAEDKCCVEFAGL